MAKINLLTIHYGKCYGAVMQTYATCKLLKEYGHIVTVINLVNPIKRGDWKRLQFWKDCFREFQFWYFKRKYFSKLTKKGFSIDEINLPDADLTIVGSDQVWNRDITGNFGMTYFLDYVPSHQQKISLASSFGKELWEEDDDYTKCVKSLLSKFSSISVREPTGVKIINEIMGLDAMTLPDPTIGYGHFEDLVLNHKPIHVVYPFLLLNNASVEEKTIHIAKALNLPVFRHSIVSCRLLNGPRKWLTRIKNSDYIITDSFHGVAFSLLFNKQFFVFCASSKKFTRIRSLLKLCSLEERYIESVEDFEQRKNALIAPIDYTSVNARLQIEQIRYRSYIQNIL